MATFKACVQKQRTDGFWPVYIRVTHQRKTSFIKTDKMVNNKGLTKTKEVKDPFVAQFCNARITDYVDRLNKVDTEHWGIQKVVEYLLSGDADICFSDYARQHYAKIFNAGQERNARNYELAYQHLERFAGTNRVMFSHLTSTFVESWIKSLSTTKRAKEMYPICIRQIFKTACKEYNDYDNGIIKIKTNPWVKVTIPSAEKPEKLAITPEECRAFFSAPIPESKMKAPLAELGRDVAMMVLCLGGINTVDIYKLRKTDYSDGVIHYKRSKTTKFRADEAYMEMKVPEILYPIFERYMTNENDESLFNFYKRHTTTDSFGANANIGIKKICESMGLPKEDWYCVYTFRHTWGTVAQNDCGASVADVAFGMNHAAGHNVTRGYLKIDYSPAWELNQKVVDFIFFTTDKSHREEKIEVNNLRVSPKYLIKAGVYFRGQLLHELQEIGFNNKEEVIDKLSEFVPEEIPNRSMLQFKVENVDKGQIAIYERMKGIGNN